MRDTWRDSPDTADAAPTQRRGWRGLEPATAWVALHATPRVRLMVLLWSMLLCVAIQQWIGRHPDAVAPALALLYVSGGIAAVLLWRTLSGLGVPASAVEVGTPAPRRQWVPALGALAGLLCAVFSAVQVPTAIWEAQTWWLAAMSVPAGALLVQRLIAWQRARRRSTPGPWRWTTPGAWRRIMPAVEGRDVAALAALLTLALAFRVPNITASPPFVHGDEAACGLFGRQFNGGQTPLLSISWYGLPMLSYAVSGLGLRLFGDTLAGLRLINALIGSASVLLTYGLARELFGRRAAFLSGLVLAVAFLHVDLSRDGIHYIQGPACVTLTLYLVVRALKRGGALTAFLAGISLIVDLQVYWSARVAPLLVLGLLLYLAVSRHRLLPARRAELLWLAAGAVTCGLPVIALFQANPGSFAGHQTDVTILGNNPGTLAHIRGVYGTTAIVPVLLQQAWSIIATFNSTGDASAQVGWGGAMVDTVSAALLPAGLLLALLRRRQWPYALCVAWFAAVAGAGMLTIDPPWWPRLAALLPAMAMLIGVLLAEITHFLERYPASLRLAGAAGIAALLLCIGIGNVRLAFNDYPAAMRQSMSMEATLVGAFLTHAPDASHTVMLSDGSMYVDYDVVQFLAPRSAGCTLLPGEPLGKCAVARTSRLYVLLPGRVGDLAWLQRQRPGGRTVEVGTFEYGASRILAYELPVAPHKT